VRSENLEAIFRRDVDRLPGLNDDEMLASMRPQRSRSAVGGTVVLAGVALLAVVVGLRVLGARDDQGTNGDGAGTRPMFIATESTAERPTGTTLVAENALTGAPACPGNQIPWLVASFSGRTGGQSSGAPTAEAAFRSANPTVTDFVMYLWTEDGPVRGDDPRIRPFIPVWIVAGSDTFLVVSPGSSNAPSTTNNWFAYQAKFMGCIVGSSPHPFPSR